MLDPSVARIVRFGVFELDLRSGELRKSGVRLNLPDQPAVYYIGCEASASPSIHRVDPLTGRDTRLGTLRDYVADFASVWRLMARPFCTREPAFPSVRS